MDYPAEVIAQHHIWNPEDATFNKYLKAAGHMRIHVRYEALEVFPSKAGAASVLLGSVLAELYNPLSVLSTQESGNVEGILSIMTPL